MCFRSGQIHPEKVLSLIDTYLCDIEQSIATVRAGIFRNFSVLRHSSRRVFTGLIARYMKFELLSRQKILIISIRLKIREHLIFMSPVASIFMRLKLCKERTKDILFGVQGRLWGKLKLSDRILFQSSRERTYSYLEISRVNCFCLY